MNNIQDWLLVFYPTITALIYIITDLILRNGDK
jgi:hypothetical protein